MLIHLIIGMHAASTFFQGELPTFFWNMHKDNFKIGGETLLVQHSQIILLRKY